MTAETEALDLIEAGAGEGCGRCRRVELKGVEARGLGVGLAATSVGTRVRRAGGWRGAGAPGTRDWSGTLTSTTFGLSASFHWVVDFFSGFGVVA